MRDVKTANPFILLHPESQQAAAEAYYAAVEKNVFNGAIPLKHAQLAAISASVAMKCVYCIPAHAAFARAAGATEEEIKTAVAIAADVALNSSMLYGSQYDMESLHADVRVRVGESGLSRELRRGHDLAESGVRPIATDK